MVLNERTSLNQLYDMIRSLLLEKFPYLNEHRPEHVDFREGYVRHSQADISKDNYLLGFEPTPPIGDGLKHAMAWYTAHLK